MAAKARIQLKTKSLYAADGRAVKELLKIAKTLQTAIKTCQETLAAGEEGEAHGAEGFTFSARPSDIAALRSTASEITDKGARMYDLLKREGGLREARESALRFLETLSSSLDARTENEHVERSVRDAIGQLKDNVAALERQAAELAEDEKTLDAKIKKRQAELLRSQKRLESLAAVRPAFMDEYEKLEAQVELAEAYEAYVTRYRNLDYLQHELDEHHKREREKVEASTRALKRLQKRLREEDNKAFRGDEHVDDEESPVSAERGGVAAGGRPLAAAGGSRGGQRGAAVPAPAPAAAGGRGAARPPPAGPSDLDDEDEDDGISNDDGEDEEGDDDGLSDGGEDDGGLDDDGGDDGDDADF